jgi:nucleoside-diphosphate-sugar epimerase
VDNVAAAVGLAVDDARSAGRVFNVAAEEAPAEVEWVRSIGDACGWIGDVVVAPTELLPPAMRSPLKARQDIIVSSERIRAELGYAETIAPGEALQRTVAWTRAYPPATEPVDYATEDAVLSAVLG